MNEGFKTQYPLIFLALGCYGEIQLRAACNAPSWMAFGSEPYPSVDYL